MSGAVWTGAVLLAVTFGAQPIAREDAPLEPSVQNEVDHAINLGERWLAHHSDTNALAGDHFATNGQTRTAIALKLVRAQRGGGYWDVSTNAAPTKLALDILKGL